MEKSLHSISIEDCDFMFVCHCNYLQVSDLNAVGFALDLSGGLDLYDISTSRS